MVIISKNVFRRYGTSRGQIAFTTKYPNFLFFISLFFSSICGHNFDRTVARKSSVPSRICLVVNGDASYKKTFNGQVVSYCQYAGLLTAFLTKLHSMAEI